jgi:hypothetical protein
VTRQITRFVRSASSTRESYADEILRTQSYEARTSGMLGSHFPSKANRRAVFLFDGDATNPPVVTLVARGGNMVAHDFDLGSIRRGLRKDCCEDENEVRQIQLLRPAKQWQVVAAEQEGEVDKSAVLPRPAVQGPERR